MFNFPSKQRAVRQVAPMVSHDGPVLRVQSILINRGACWNTSGATKTYLRAAATDEELSDMRYPAQGFRTFLRVREEKP
jgi:hypothetical protein